MNIKRSIFNLHFSFYNPGLHLVAKHNDIVKNK